MLARLGVHVPAILFDNVAGSPDAQIVMNTHGSWQNHALALGMDKDTPIKEQFFEFVRRFEKYETGEIERVDSAPWQEVVVDIDINLFELLPLFRLNTGDGGTYIDKACIVSRDPDDHDNDNVENAGIYRLMVKGPNRLGIQPVPQHDIAIHLSHAEARGEDLPIAIAISDEPLIALRSATPLRYDQLEYKMASAMQGAPYKLVQPEKGLDVPWGSEYILEGRILSRQRELEGPFGGFTGYYSGGRNYPVIEIDRVSHRKKPIFESCYVGRPWKEIDYLQARRPARRSISSSRSCFPKWSQSMRSTRTALSSSSRPRCAMAGSASRSGWAC